MTAWEDPRFGVVHLLPRGLQPKKIWTHFYNVAEHWERLCDVDVDALRTETEGELEVRRVDQRELPSLGGRARAMFERHHDLGYGPAYKRELASAETIWTPKKDTLRRYRALTPGSVFGVIQVDDVAWVVTAFRPLPPTKRVDWDEMQIRQQARRYFAKETMMHIEERARTICEELRRASATAPDNEAELWFLASAIGHGHLMSGHPDVASALRLAEVALGQTVGALLESLRGSLDWSGTLARLASALKEARPEDIESALASIEDLFAVAPVVGAESEAKMFWEEAEGLIAWIPAEWDHLAELAAARRTLVEDSDHRVAHLWMTVEEAVLGAVVRETEPVVRPEPRYVNLLIPEEGLLDRWLRRIRGATRRVTSALDDVMVQTLANASVGLQPRPLGSNASARTWQVHGRPAPTNGLHFRAFVVGSDAPDGYDVTERFVTPDDGYLWDINGADERVLLVVVVASAPIAGDTLEAVVADAESRTDALVDVRELQPTQVTKAKR